MTSGTFKLLKKMEPRIKSCERDRNNNVIVEIAFLRKYEEKLNEFIRICEEYEEEELQIVKSNNNENIVLKIVSDYGFLERILSIL